jgi:pilus assembly protein Flp/PilA
MSLLFTQLSYAVARRWPRRAAHAGRGQGLVEYALIIALVAIVVVAALLVLGPSVSKVFTKINSSL